MVGQKFVGALRRHGLLLKIKNPGCPRAGIHTGNIAIPAKIRLLRKESRDNDAVQTPKTSPISRGNRIGLAAMRATNGRSSDLFRSLAPSRRRASGGLRRFPARASDNLARRAGCGKSAHTLSVREITAAGTVGDSHPVPDALSPRLCMPSGITGAEQPFLLQR